MSTSFSRRARCAARNACENAGWSLEMSTSRASSKAPTCRCSLSASCSSDASCCSTSSSRSKNHFSTSWRKAPRSSADVRRFSRARRYTVSRRCSGVSTSLICTSVTAMPRSSARADSQREKKVLPAPYSPRTALKSPRPVVQVVSSSPSTFSKRERPTARCSRPFSGTVPWRSARTMSLRRAGDSGGKPEGGSDVTMELQQRGAATAHDRVRRPFASCPSQSPAHHRH